MPQIQINLRETIEVPEGSKIVLARTGLTMGIRLPNGDLIKPWVQYERYVDPDGDGEDIGTSELMDLGVTPDLEFDRDIQQSYGSDGEVEIDDSAIRQD
jgi:hypothetical protein